MHACSRESVLSIRLAKTKDKKGREEKSPFHTNIKGADSALAMRNGHDEHKGGFVYANNAHLLGRQANFSTNYKSNEKTQFSRQISQPKRRNSAVHRRYRSSDDSKKSSSVYSFEAVQTSDSGKQSESSKYSLSESSMRSADRHLSDSSDQSWRTRSRSRLGSGRGTSSGDQDSSLIAQDEKTHVSGKENASRRSESTVVSRAVPCAGKRHRALGRACSRGSCMSLALSGGYSQASFHGWSTGTYSTRSEESTSGTIAGKHSKRESTVVNSRLKVNLCKHREDAVERKNKNSVFVSKCKPLSDSKKIAVSVRREVVTFTPDQIVGQARSVSTDACTDRSTKRYKKSAASQCQSTCSSYDSTSRIKSKIKTSYLEETSPVEVMEKDLYNNSECVFLNKRLRLKHDGYNSSERQVTNCAFSDRETLVKACGGRNKPGKQDDVDANTFKVKTKDSLMNQTNQSSNWSIQSPRNSHVSGLSCPWRSRDTRCSVDDLHMKCLWKTSCSKTGGQMGRSSFAEAKRRYARAVPSEDRESSVEGGGYSSSGDWPNRSPGSRTSILKQSKNIDRSGKVNDSEGHLDRPYARWSGVMTGEQDECRREDNSKGNERRVVKIESEKRNARDMRTRETLRKTVSSRNKPQQVSELVSKDTIQSSRVVEASGRRGIDAESGSSESAYESEYLSKRFKRETNTQEERHKRHLLTKEVSGKSNVNRNVNPQKLEFVRCTAGHTKQSAIKCEKCPSRKEGCKGDIERSNEKMKLVFGDSQSFFVKKYACKYRKSSPSQVKFSDSRVENPPKIAGLELVRRDMSIANKNIKHVSKCPNAVKTKEVSGKSNVNRNVNPQKLEFVRCTAGHTKQSAIKCEKCPSRKEGCKGDIERSNEKIKLVLGDSQSFFVKKYACKYRKSSPSQVKFSDSRVENPSKIAGLELVRRDMSIANKNIKHVSKCPNAVKTNDDLPICRNADKRGEIGTEIRLPRKDCLTKQGHYKTRKKQDDITFVRQSPCELERDETLRSRGGPKGERTEIDKIGPSSLRLGTNRAADIMVPRPVPRSQRSSDSGSVCRKGILKTDQCKARIKVEMQTTRPKHTQLRQVFRDCQGKCTSTDSSENLDKISEKNVQEDDFRSRMEQKYSSPAKICENQVKKEFHDQASRRMSDTQISRDGENVHEEDTLFDSYSNARDSGNAGQGIGVTKRPQQRRVDDERQSEAKGTDSELPVSLRPAQRKSVLRKYGVGAEGEVVPKAHSGIRAPDSAVTRGMRDKSKSLDLGEGHGPSETRHQPLRHSTLHGRKGQENKTESSGDDTHIASGENSISSGKEDIAKIQQSVSRRRLGNKVHSDRDIAGQPLQERETSFKYSVRSKTSSEDEHQSKHSKQLERRNEAIDRRPTPSGTLARKFGVDNRSKEHSLTPQSDSYSSSASETKKKSFKGKGSRKKYDGPLVTDGSDAHEKSLPPEGYGARKEVSGNYPEVSTAVRKSKDTKIGDNKGKHKKFKGEESSKILNSNKALTGSTFPEDSGKVTSSQIVRKFGVDKVSRKPLGKIHHVPVQDKRKHRGSRKSSTTELHGSSETERTPKMANSTRLHEKKISSIAERESSQHHDKQRQEREYSKNTSKTTTREKFAGNNFKGESRLKVSAMNEGEGSDNITDSDRSLSSRSLLSVESLAEVKRVIRKYGVDKVSRKPLGKIRGGQQNKKNRSKKHHKEDKRPSTISSESSAKNKVPKRERRPVLDDTRHTPSESGGSAGTSRGPAPSAVLKADQRMKKEKGERKPQSEDRDELTSTSETSSTIGFGTEATRKVIRKFGVDKVSRKPLGKIRGGSLQNKRSSSKEHHSHASRESKRGVSSEDDKTKKETKKKTKDSKDRVNLPSASSNHQKHHSHAPRESKRGGSSEDDKTKKETKKKTKDSKDRANLPSASSNREHAKVSSNLKNVDNMHQKDINASDNFLNEGKREQIGPRKAMEVKGVNEVSSTSILSTEGSSEVALKRFVRKFGVDKVSRKPLGKIRGGYVRTKKQRRNSKKSGTKKSPDSSEKNTSSERTKGFKEHRQKTIRSQNYASVPSSSQQSTEKKRSNKEHLGNEEGNFSDGSYPKETKKKLEKINEQSLPPTNSKPTTESSNREAPKRFIRRFGVDKVSRKPLGKIRGGIVQKNKSSSKNHHRDHHKSIISKASGSSTEGKPSKKSERAKTDTSGSSVSAEHSFSSNDRVYGESKIERKIKKSEKSVLDESYPEATKNHERKSRLTVIHKDGESIADKEKSAEVHTKYSEEKKLVDRKFGVEKVSRKSVGKTRERADLAETTPLGKYAHGDAKKDRDSSSSSSGKEIALTTKGIFNKRFKKKDAEEDTVPERARNLKVGSKNEWEEIQMGKRTAKENESRSKERKDYKAGNRTKTLEPRIDESSVISNRHKNISENLEEARKPAENKFGIEKETSKSVGIIHGGRDNSVGIQTRPRILEKSHAETNSTHGKKPSKETSAKQGGKAKNARTSGERDAESVPTDAVKYGQRRPLREKYGMDDASRKPLREARTEGKQGGKPEKTLSPKISAIDLPPEEVGDERRSFQKQINETTRNEKSQMAQKDTQLKQARIPFLTEEKIGQKANGGKNAEFQKSHKGSKDKKCLKDDHLVTKENQGVTPKKKLENVYESPARKSEAKSVIRNHTLPPRTTPKSKGTVGEGGKQTKITLKQEARQSDETCGGKSDIGIEKNEERGKMRQDKTIKDTKNCEDIPANEELGKRNLNGKKKSVALDSKAIADPPKIYMRNLSRKCLRQVHKDVKEGMQQKERENKMQLLSSDNTNKGKSAALDGKELIPEQKGDSKETERKSKCRYFNNAQKDIDGQKSANKTVKWDKEINERKAVEQDTKVGKRWSCDSQARKTDERGTEREPGKLEMEVTNSDEAEETEPDKGIKARELKKQTKDTKFKYVERKVPDKEIEVMEPMQEQDAKLKYVEGREPDEGIKRVRDPKKERTLQDENVPGSAKQITGDHAFKYRDMGTGDDSFKQPELKEWRERRNIKQLEDENEWIDVSSVGRRRKCVEKRFKKKENTGMNNQNEKKEQVKGQSMELDEYGYRNISDPQGRKKRHNTYTHINVKELEEEPQKIYFRNLPRETLIEVRRDIKETIRRKRHVSKNVSDFRKPFRLIIENERKKRQSISGRYTNVKKLTGNRVTSPKGIRIDETYDTGVDVRCEGARNDKKEKRFMIIPNSCDQKIRARSGAWNIKSEELSPRTSPRNLQRKFIMEMRKEMKTALLKKHIETESVKKQLRVVREQKGEMHIRPCRANASCHRRAAARLHSMEPQVELQTLSESSHKVPIDKCHLRHKIKIVPCPKKGANVRPSSQGEQRKRACGCELKQVRSYPKNQESRFGQYGCETGFVRIGTQPLQRRQSERSESVKLIFPSVTSSYACQSLTDASRKCISAQSTKKSRLAMRSAGKRSEKWKSLEINGEGENVTSCNVRDVQTFQGVFNGNVRSKELLLPNKVTNVPSNIMGGQENAAHDDIERRSIDEISSSHVCLQRAARKARHSAVASCHDSKQTPLADGEGDIQMR